MNTGEMTELLGTLEPFAHLDPDDRLVLAGRAEVVSVRRKERLFDRGDEDQWMFFVLEGRVQLEADDGRGMDVDGGTQAAARPLAQLKPRRYRGIAVTPVTCLKVDVTGLGTLQRPDGTGQFSAQYVVEEMPDDGPDDMDDLVLRCGRRLEKGEFRLPSLPHIAMDAVRAIDRDDADAGDLATILINDPPITAKLIKAANSPLFHGMSAVENCDKAIVRLGMKTARQLIVAFAMRELFDAKTPALRRRMEALWQHSTEVAAIAMVLSRELKCLDPGEAMVAGLLHDIGLVPIYNLASEDPELAANERSLDELASAHRGEMGARLLGDWNFSDALVTAAREAEDWWREGGTTPDYADLVIVAQLHGYLGRADAPDVPPMVKLPAFARVTAKAGLDPAGSMALLKEARARIQEAQSLLSG